MTPSFDRDAFFAAAWKNLENPDGTLDAEDAVDPTGDQRWSTWPETAHTLDRGPQPFPTWVVQHDGALDTELGVLRTGKEADAFLIERALPDRHRTGAEGEEVLMVAKRYRAPEHSSFHRSAVYTEGRRGRDSRESRAVARGTAFGREVAAARWARAEFDALCRLWAAGLPVPYPVQIIGTEVCMEFIGAPDPSTGTPTAAPRLHEQRPQPEVATAWAECLRQVVVCLAGLGLVHGDLSAYNVLVDPRASAHGAHRLVVIDVPQMVDLIANANGAAFLQRDCRNLCTWLRAHGADAAATDPHAWFAEATDLAP